MAVHINHRRGEGYVNRIASLYGKEKSGRWLEKQVEAGRLLYADKEKALRLSGSTGLQLPGDVLDARADLAGPRKIIFRKMGEVEKNPHEYFHICLPDPARSDSAGALLSQGVLTKEQIKAAAQKGDDDLVAVTNGQYPAME